MSLNRNRLEQAAGVSFHDDAEAQLLLDLVKIWDEARDTRTSDKLRQLLKLRKQARVLEADVTAFELLVHDDAPSREVTDRQFPQYVLNIIVGEVAAIWREHGGKGTGSYYSDVKGHHNGALIRLLLELFEQAGIPEQRRPSRHSLHDTVLTLSVPPGLPPP